MKIVSKDPSSFRVLAWVGGCFLISFLIFISTATSNAIAEEEGTNKVLKESKSDDQDKAKADEDDQDKKPIIKNKEKYKDDDDDDDEDSNRGPVVVSVPENLRGRGYELRLFESMSFPLEKDTIEIDTRGYNIGAELVDFDNRVLSREKVNIDKTMLISMHKRELRLGVTYGTTAAPRSEWRDIFLRGDFITYDFEFGYQPSCFGMLVAIGGTAADRSLDGGLQTSYDSTHVKLGVVYEAAPFRHTLKRLHLVGFGGVLNASHEVEIKDDIVKLSGRSNNFGFFGGVGLALPTIDNFWVSSRLYFTKQKIVIEEVDFEAKEIMTTFNVGVYYAL